jgi:Na+/H+ antiporter NhaD/arsenite permease-like protein
MLLIRPLLQTNHERKHVVHTVVFFIFLVSNVGGCLLPIGDPPLFLGFLKGVPFFWTLTLWAPWLICCLVLLIVYYCWDSIAYRKETVSSHTWDEATVRPLRLKGWVNIALLVGIVACVAFVDPNRPLPFTGGETAEAIVLDGVEAGHDAGHGERPPGIYPFPFSRELLMLLLVLASIWRTPSGVREHNSFNYVAILEVAALFVGIFIAMQVPIEYLNARGAELGVNTPWKFFWATGGLSSFLDNAPTYVVFFETAKVLPPDGTATLALGGGGGQINIGFLVAISLGSVFMGSMTYIGNGPNFMVKSIAEQTGIRMPSFFGYLFKYSVPILIPVFILITVLFLMPWSPLA